jgi:formylmethanofuran dehydrogenase subunit E
MIKRRYGDYMKRKLTVQGFCCWIVTLLLALGATDRSYGEDLIPAFGLGTIQVILYTDYFCPPCRSMEPDVEPLLKDLMKTEKINLTFVDTPTNQLTALYARYFIYALNANQEFDEVLKARNTLFEAAEKRIQEKPKLEEFLKEKGINWKTVEVTPAFNFWNRLLKNDNIRSTPSCVIIKGEKKEIFVGTLEILKALENLKKDIATGAQDARVAEAPQVPAIKDITPEWFFPEWLGTSPYAPSFEVRDTVNKYGRYAGLTKTITIKDLIKYHGHFCGGLVESAGALRVAFDLLFPDGVVDRTDLLIVSNNSACGGDVAAYLTGARLRFASHHIDNSLTESEFFVQKISTGRTIHVKLNPDVYPAEVKTQMKKIESGNFTPQDTDLFQELQWAYARRMINKPLKDSFIIEEVPGFKWPEPVWRDLGARKDNDYKNVPLK